MDKHLTVTGDICNIRLKEGNMYSVFIWTAYCTKNGWKINNWDGYKTFCRTWGTRIKWIS